MKSAALFLVATAAGLVQAEQFPLQSESTHCSFAAAAPLSLTPHQSADDVPNKVTIQRFSAWFHCQGLVKNDDICEDEFVELEEVQERGNTGDEFACVVGEECRKADGDVFCVNPLTADYRFPDGTVTNLVTGYSITGAGERQANVWNSFIKKRNAAATAPLAPPLTQTFETFSASYTSTPGAPKATLAPPATFTDTFTPSFTTSVTEPAGKPTGQPASSDEASTTSSGSTSGSPASTPTPTPSNPPSAGERLAVSRWSLMALGASVVLYML